MHIYIYANTCVYIFVCVIVHVKCICVYGNLDTRHFTRIHPQFGYAGSSKIKI